MDNLLKRAAQAANRAYAPYSQFRVGAAVELVDGQIVEGNNQECAASPLCICAERVALATAFAANPSAVVRRIAVYSPNTPSGIAPCGACREFIAECARRCGVDIEVLGLPDNQTMPISLLLPHQFTIDSV